MSAKQPTTSDHSPTITNKKARFNYDIIESCEAGLILVGSEVKSLRAGRASLGEAYVRIIGTQAWLVGANISLYEQAGRDNHDPDRQRKLLLHKREIKRLGAKVREKGFTIVPLRLYFNARGFAKIKIALARGKAVHDKRRQIRDRDGKRDLARQMKKYR